LDWGNQDTGVADVTIAGIPVSSLIKNHFLIYSFLLNVSFNLVSLIFGGTGMKFSGDKSIPGYRRFANY
jgi:hypothetical protein